MRYIHYESANESLIDYTYANDLLYYLGTTLGQMQFMQVTFSLGSAAEDIFSAYIYSVVSVSSYQRFTSYLRMSGLVSHVLSGIIGDVLVTQFYASLDVLMVISAVSVLAGAVVGLVILRSPQWYRQRLHTASTTTSVSSPHTRKLDTHLKLPRSYQDVKYIYNTHIKNQVRQLYSQCIFIGKVLVMPEISAFTVYFVLGNCVFSVRHVLLMLVALMCICFFVFTICIAYCIFTALHQRHRHNYLIQNILHKTI